MSEGVLIALAAALVLAAAALWLWSWSVRARERQHATAHLERQLLADAQPLPEAPPWMRALAEMPGDVPAALAPGEVVAAPVLTLSQRLGRWMPGWLQGAVSPGRILIGIVVWLVLASIAGLWAGAVAATGALVLGVLLGAFAIWLAVQRFRRKLTRQLPAFIDAMVRLITIGNSVQAAFQLSIASTQLPLRDHLEQAAGLVRAGVDLDQALHQMARNVRVEEVALLAGILGLSVRYGGRADVLLERVANYMRDREQAEQELFALSAETRLSAWILGLLPVVVGFLIVVLNAAYFSRMWADETGRLLVYGAGGLQVFGAFLLYRLARLT